MQGKTVMVIGASGLLGSEFSRAILEAGGTVIGVDVAPKNLGSRIHPQICDVSQPDQVEALFNQCFETFPRIDALVNCAYPRNANYGAKFEDVTYADFCENITLLSGSTFLCSQKSIPYFKRQGFGSIVHISSVYGVVAPRFDIYENTSMTMPVEYAVAKAGIVHFTQYLASYLKGTGIRVNCISLGGLLAGQPEAFLNQYRRYCNSKGMLDPQDVSGALLYLLSDGARFVNGQNLIVDDGFTL